MRNWKKFMAIGLAASIIMSFGVPQILWASEFSAESGETVADVFGDNSESETGNKTTDKNNEKSEFDTGEPEKEKRTEDISDGENKLKRENKLKNGSLNNTEDNIKNQMPEQSEKEAEEDAGQNAEGYTVQLYSNGKIEKTYVVSDINNAKAPEALKGKSGYTFKEWNTKEDGSGEAYKPGDSITKLLQAVNLTGENQNLPEENETEPVQYAKTSADIMAAETIADCPSNKNVESEVIEYYSSSENSGLEETAAIAANANDSTIILYAIWEKATSYSITYKLNKGKNNSANPKSFTAEDEIKLKNPTRSGYHFVGWYTDSKYKKKISVIEKGTEGAIILYAKWIKEVGPSAKAASLNSIKGTKAKTITASATISNYVKSKDSYYYLVYVDSNSGKVKKAAAKAKKPETANAKVTFQLDISGHPEYVQGKFAVGVKKSNSAYTVISSRNYVSNPEKLSSNTAAYFVPKTKKGIQITDVSALTETKSNTAFFNLYASQIMSGGVEYRYNGKKYYFNDLYGLKSMVRQCNAKGIQITAQISLDKSSNTQGMITGNSPYSDTAYYGWNTNNSTARQTMEAMFAYLSEIFGTDNCYVSNWILGNEINSASRYYYVGNVSFSKYMSMYSEAFRCLYNAVRSNRGSSKVFICLDNCWNQKNIFSICYTSKSTLDSFAATVSKLQKGINWNLAYHAYSQPLTEEKFWSSVNSPLLTNDGNTAIFITMHNIQALTDYVKNKFGSGTRVILSEQGFSSSYGGQANQAASMALAYYKAACNPMIDAFIIRSYQDEGHEVAQGLALGLKDSNGKKKTVYNVFCNMDSSNSLKYTEKILNSQVGNWKSQIPGYNVKRLSSMYRN